MYKRTLTTALILTLSAPTWSFTCYLTLAKDNCWTNYNLSVDVVDANKNVVLTTIAVPAGKSWTRQEFTCEPTQKLMYNAQFNPVIWQGSEGKVYPAERFWFLPGTVNPGDTAWTIPVCYPADFSQVPFPPDAKSNKCACDFDSIPPVTPK